MVKKISKTVFNKLGPRLSWVTYSVDPEMHNFNLRQAYTYHGLIRNCVDFGSSQTHKIIFMNWNRVMQLGAGQSKFKIVVVVWLVSNKWQHRQHYRKWSWLLTDLLCVHAYHGLFFQLEITAISLAIPVLLPWHPLWNAVGREWPV